MARRAAPANRLKVEAALGCVSVSGPTLLDSVYDFARVLGIDPAHWQDDPALQLIGETVAAAVLLDEILTEDPQAREGAILTVAIRLGLNEKTLDARLRRTTSQRGVESVA